MRTPHWQLRDVVLSGLYTGIDGAPLVGEPEVVSLAGVAAQDVPWLWPGRIARGKVTVLAGEPGVGASLIALDVAARVSSGKPWPDRVNAQAPAHRPRGVLLLIAGDGLADTVRPRLGAAGADVERVFALKTIGHTNCISKNKEHLRFSLEHDLPALSNAIDGMADCRLVVIDPVWAYAKGCPTSRMPEARQLLEALGELAEKRDVAILVVAQLPPATAGLGAVRAAKALAFTAAAGTGWVLMRDVADPTGQRRMFLPVKNNLGDDRAGLMYRLTDAAAVRGGSTDAAGGAEGCKTAARVVWEDEPVLIQGVEGLAGIYGRSAKLEAVDWLRDVLGDGWQLAAEVKDQARLDGIGLRTLDRAKVILGVRGRRIGGSNGYWVWHLPGALPPDSFSMTPSEVPAQAVSVGEDGSNSDVAAQDAALRRSKIIAELATTAAALEARRALSGDLNGGEQ